MRWKISHHGHDPRQIDLLAVAALVILVIAAFSYFADRSYAPASHASFIVPSQSVRW
jgi:drug/metabolite transporter (DMT)-like permease